MKKEINNYILLADFSKTYNPFRVVYSVFFPAIALIALYVFLIFFLKFLGYSNEELSWLPIFNIEQFPFEGRIIEYIGVIILFILGIFLFSLGGYYFFHGKVCFVKYDTVKRELVSIRNGLSKKKTSVAIDQIKYLRKKREKRSPNSISTGQHRVQTISLQNNRAFAVMKDTNVYVYLFEHYDKKKFDNTFREINKFVKEKKK
jgi:hypothetical protein